MWIILKYIHLIKYFNSIFVGITFLPYLSSVSAIQYVVIYLTELNLLQIVIHTNLLITHFSNTVSRTVSSISLTFFIYNIKINFAVWVFIWELM
jgi:hypothetical protein